jgi:hypothetical protein
VVNVTPTFFYSWLLYGRAGCREGSHLHSGITATYFVRMFRFHYLERMYSPAERAPFKARWSGPAASSCQSSPSRNQAAGPSPLGKPSRLRPRRNHQIIAAVTLRSNVRGHDKALSA